MKPNHSLSFFLTFLIIMMSSCQDAGNQTASMSDTRDQTMVGANLYLQSAAEFAFVCKQTFENAAEAVTALSEEVPSDRPYAVVMDLDETVLDNSAYQNHLYNTNEGYNRASWNQFVKEAATFDSLITLVPGVYDFIDHCKSLDIQVIFISNRMNETRVETAVTLAKLGIDTVGLTCEDSKLMLLRTAESNKDARRDTVRKYFDPQIFIGDNLSDFTSELEELDQRSRRNAVLERYADEIGKRWFLIPNPTYGDWVSGSSRRNAEYIISQD